MAAGTWSNPRCTERRSEGGEEACEICLLQVNDKYTHKEHVRISVTHVDLEQFSAVRVWYVCMQGWAVLINIVPRYFLKNMYVCVCVHTHVYVSEYWLFTHSPSALVNLVESLSSSVSDNSGHSSFSMDCRQAGHVTIT